MISIMHVVDLHVENPWFNGFAKHHDRNRFRHVVTSIGPRCGLHEALEPRGIRTYALATHSRKEYPAAIWRLRRLLCDERIDIVQTHQFDPSVMGLLAAGMARTPVRIVTRHHSDFTTLFHKPLHRRLDRWQALYADHVIAASHAVKRAMMEYEGVPESRIAVAQYGYDFDLLCPSLDASERQSLRREFGADDRFLLMAVARLSVEKGLCYLLEAMPQVVERRPDVLLLILGGGPLEEELQRDIAQRGLGEHVRLLGWRDDARALMQAADLIVHPSLHEAFCSVIIESMALERPLIATDVAAAPEQIDHDETGVLIPPRDPAAIARSILELAADPARRRRLGAAARRRVRERFNFPKMMRLYEDLYEQWHAERRRRRRPLRHSPGPCPQTSVVGSPER
jgi:glycosyltransferase involved in cell wall biosynthesis